MIQLWEDVLFETMMGPMQLARVGSLGKHTTLYLLTVSVAASFMTN